jgi:pimeloyl-ACP methyl ester carboxylesterase
VQNRHVKRRRCAILVALLVAPVWMGSLAGAPCSDGPSFRFDRRECAAAFAKGGALCGVVAVPENYADPGIRTISLNVVVFPATEPGRVKAAQFDIEGGPGFAVTESADFYATDGASYRRHRDVVLVDMRGTGASNPLRCVGLESHAAAQPMAPFYPPDKVRECAQRLSAVADLRQYGTAAAARDLDAVREALGYSEIDLNALSYGTTLALRYIADYPQRVRTAVLTATTPPQKTPPAHHAAAAERGLQLLFAACAGDRVCSARHPSLSAGLDRAVQRLPPESRPIFLEKLRAFLYQPLSARRVPAIIQKASEGDFESFTRRRGPGRMFADGLYLSITCSESLARMDFDQAIVESRGTRFGSYRLERQREACRQWPVAPPDPQLFRTGRYEPPVLFLSGALDPVTPPEWTAEVSKMFPNSRHVIAPQGAHVLEGMTGMDTCVDAMILKFVESRSVTSIDPACVESMSSGPFVSP